MQANCQDIFVVSCKYKAIIDRIKPYGNGGLIKHFLTVKQTDQHIQQGGHDRQNDLTPHFGPFYTENNAGHYRTNHAKCHQPGQRIFMADKEANSLFHSNVSIHRLFIICNKKYPEIQKFPDIHCIHTKSNLFFTAAINAGAVPQQPPRRLAPIAAQSAIISANSSGAMG